MTPNSIATCLPAGHQPTCQPALQGPRPPLPGRTGGSVGLAYYSNMLIKRRLSVWVVLVILAAPAAQAAEQSLAVQATEPLPRIEPEVWGASSDGNAEAVAQIKQRFHESTSREERRDIVRHLVMFHHADPEHFDYLLEIGGQALQDPIPFSVESAWDGTSHVPELSEQFVAWARAHEMSLEDAGRAGMEQAQDFGLVATSGGPLVLPVLREALLAESGMMFLSAARALARLGDERSIQTIYERGLEGPWDYTFGAGLMLLDFNSEETDRLSEELIGHLPEFADLLREHRQRRSFTPEERLRRSQEAARKRPRPPVASPEADPPR